MIPPEFLTENKRLQWDFIFGNESGAPTQYIKYIKDYKNKNMDEILKAYLPYSVYANFSLGDFAEGGEHRDGAETWLRENCNHAWQIWSYNSPNLLFMFEDQHDAVLFKLRWG